MLVVPKARIFGNVLVGEGANYTSTTATVPGCKGNGCRRVQTNDDARVVSFSGVPGWAGLSG